MTPLEYLHSPYPKDPVASKKIREDILRQISNDYPSRIKYNIYVTPKNTMVIHTTVPSRTKERVNHDVVITFDAPDRNDEKNTLAHLPFRAFSNSPSFYFRFARAFRRENMFVEFLANRLNPEVFQMPKSGIEPEVGYERTIYTALYLLYRDGVLSSVFFSLARRSPRKSETQIYAMVHSQTDIETGRATNKDTKQERARKENIADRRAVREAGKQTIPMIASVKRVGNTVRVKTTQQSKKSAKIKKIKHL